MKQVTIKDVRTEPRHSAGYKPLTVSASVGDITCRYYEAPNATQAIIMLGESNAGWQSPSRGLYPLIARNLQTRDMSTLHVQMTHPGNLEKSVSEIKAATAFLKNEGIEWLGFVGYGYGGAVAIQSAAQLSFVSTVVVLATQGFGTTAVKQFEAATALLLLHGTDDTTLSPDCSVLAYHWAGEPKQLLLYEGVGHSFDTVAEQIYPTIRDWILNTI